MEGQDYLNQISASNRPVKASKGLGGVLSSKFLWIGVVAVAALVMIAIAGSMLGSGKNDDKVLTVALKTHIDNTLSVMNEYQSSVKSSNLRSSSASLTGILSNTSASLDGYISSSAKGVKATAKQVKDAEETKEALKNDLFEAKITGNLDRIYAHKMAYEISLLKSEESRIIGATNNEALKEILDGSRSSLENLYSEFDNFSETK